MGKKKTIDVISKFLVEHACATGQNPVKKLVKDVTGIGFLTVDESIHAAKLIIELFKLDKALAKHGSVEGFEFRRFIDFSEKSKDYMLYRMIGNGLFEKNYTVFDLNSLVGGSRGHHHFRSMAAVFEEGEEVVADFGKSTSKRRPFVTLMKRHEIADIFKGVLKNAVEVYQDSGVGNIFETLYDKHKELSTFSKFDRFSWFIKNFCSCDPEQTLKAAEELRSINPKELRLRGFSTTIADRTTVSEKYTIAFMDLFHFNPATGAVEKNKNVGPTIARNSKPDYLLKINNVELNELIGGSDKLVISDRDMDRFWWEVENFLNRNEDGSVRY